MGIPAGKEKSSRERSFGEQQAKQLVWLN